MKQWKRDLGIVRELGPDTPAFDEAVQRVWDHVEAVEEECRRLRGLPRTATGWQNRAEAAEAELEAQRIATDTLARRSADLERAVERVKAERDELDQRAAGYLRLLDHRQARLDKALAALRDSDALIRYLRPDLTHTRVRADRIVEANRAAIAEIEA